MQKIPNQRTPRVHYRVQDTCVQCTLYKAYTWLMQVAWTARVVQIHHLTQWFYHLSSLQIYLTLLYSYSTEAQSSVYNNLMSSDTSSPHRVIILEGTSDI